MSSRLDDLLTETKRLRAIRDQAQQLLDAAEQDVLEERFRNVPKFQVGDVISVPRKLFGEWRMWPAQIAQVHLRYSEGFWPDTHATDPGRHWERHQVSYTVFLQQKDGSFGGSSESFSHDHVEPMPAL